MVTTGKVLSLISLPKRFRSIPLHASTDAGFQHIQASLHPHRCWRSFNNLSIPKALYSPRKIEARASQRFSPNLKTNWCRGRETYMVNSRFQYQIKVVGEMVSSFEELGWTGEAMGALEEMGISLPTEIHCIGIPAVLKGKSVVLGSHTGSGKTLAYLLPLIQLMRKDEALHGMLMKPRRPRAVVLCPTRELCEQVNHDKRGQSFKSPKRFFEQPNCHHGRDPGSVLQQIEEGNMVYGDIRFLVLDEANTMFDRGFGPDIRKFIGPLKTVLRKQTV